MIWQWSATTEGPEQFAQRRKGLDPVRFADTLAIGADFVATNFEEALAAAFDVKPATILPVTAQTKPTRRRIPATA